MGFIANVLNVMIASPGDVAEERDIVTQEIYRWNDANASARKLVLLPVKWETHSTPQLGAPPQSIINRQLLADADIVIGIFGTRIGTATEEYVSGTVEEIKKHAAAGKTTKVYFSDVPVSPSEMNLEQLDSVRKFREECTSMGLYAAFRSREEFRSQFSQHLTIELNQGRYLWKAAPGSAPQDETNESQLTKDELRIVELAAAGDGRIACHESVDDFIFQAGNFRYSVDAPRTFAQLRSALIHLQTLGMVGHVSGSYYRLTGAGYEMADKAAEQASQNAFASGQQSHTKAIVDGLNFIQRDLLRLLLLKGGSVNNAVISHALGSHGGIDMNGLTNPLTFDGLVTRIDDPPNGTSTFTIQTDTQILRKMLFPRDEGDKPPFFLGIPA